ncbi:MAG: SDR family NAD(P)-dependent oxidoreductase [Candidatus Micrarchaeaceae archaeon]
MDKISGKSVFVTGGAGFIGSSFSRLLVEQECNVVVYDNLSSGRIEMIKDLEAKKNFKFVMADLLDVQKLEQAMHIAKPDVVIHLAANSDVQNGIKNTRLDLEQGTIATFNLLDAARKKDVKDILFSSSSVVYGLAKIKPTPEDYGPLKPISFYGASKLASEGLITAFSSLYGMNYYIFRFANIVGKNLTHGVILDFLRKLDKNSKKLDVLGNGTQRKSYMDVMDCIGAMLFVYKKSGDRENIYNLSLDDQITVKEIAELAVSEVAPGAKINYSKENFGWPGDVSDSYISNEKLKKLGFSPKCKTSREVVLHAIKACKEQILGNQLL